MLAQKTSSTVDITPARILETGLAFWASKTLLTAVNLQLFTFLADGAKSGDQIKESLGLHGRGLYDFLDTLVALKLLYREGIKEEAIYFNTLEGDMFLDKNKPTYVGGMLEMANNRLYPFWNNLEEGLKTGQPQNEVKSGMEPLFEALYADENRLEEFVAAMAGTQTGNFAAFAKQFNFTNYKTHCDIGGAGGSLSAQIALNNRHMQSVTYDLPAVAPIAQRYIDKLFLQQRVAVVSGNFFTDEFPQADLITMGNILHDWDLEQKQALIAKAYDALPAGGALAVIENVIDDQRKHNAFGLMMSLNMQIETPGGFDYTATDFTHWAVKAGFSHVEIMPLGGPASALIAYK